jgi:hypothetical protein
MGLVFTDSVGNVLYQACVFRKELFLDHQLDVGEGFLQSIGRPDWRHVVLSPLEVIDSQKSRGRSRVRCDSDIMKEALYRFPRRFKTHPPVDGRSFASIADTPGARRGQNEG